MRISQSPFDTVLLARQFLGNNKFRMVQRRQLAKVQRDTSRFPSAPRSNLPAQAGALHPLVLHYVTRRGSAFYDQYIEQQAAPERVHAECEITFTTR
jgi:hypothetical protein